MMERGRLQIDGGTEASKVKNTKWWGVETIGKHYDTDEKNAQEGIVVRMESDKSGYVQTSGNMV